MSARQVVRSGSEIHEQSCPIAGNKLCATPLTLVLEKRIPSLAKCVALRKKPADVFSDQFIDRESENSCGGRICVETVPLVVDNEDSVEYILKD